MICEFCFHLIQFPLKLFFESSSLAKKYLEKCCFPSVEVFLLPSCYWFQILFKCGQRRFFVSFKNLKKIFVTLVMWSSVGSLLAYISWIHDKWFLIGSLWLLIFLSSYLFFMTFLSTSVYGWKVSIEMYKCNNGFVFFYFHWFYHLLYIFCSSIVLCTHL